jgi:hypothetical protein
VIVAHMAMPWTVRPFAKTRPVFRSDSRSPSRRQAIDEHLAASGKRPGDFLFHGRRDKNRYLSTRQYARLLSEWIASIGRCRATPR